MALAVDEDQYPVGHSPLVQDAVARGHAAMGPEVGEQRERQGAEGAGVRMQRVCVVAGDTEDLDLVFAELGDASLN
jgi:hypothetical protein